MGTSRRIWCHDKVWHKMEPSHVTVHIRPLSYGRHTSILLWYHVIYTYLNCCMHHCSRYQHMILIPHANHLEYNEMLSNEIIPQREMYGIHSMSSCWVQLIHTQNSTITSFPLQGWYMQAHGYSLIYHGTRIKPVYAIKVVKDPYWKMSKKKIVTILEKCSF